MRYLSDSLLNQRISIKVLFSILDACAASVGIRVNVTLLAMLQYHD